MTNKINFKGNIIAAVAAFAVSSTVILGTVGPVQAGSNSGSAQVIASQADNETPSALIA